MTNTEADERGVNLLGGAAEEVLGEVLGQRSGFRGGLGMKKHLIQASSSKHERMVPYKDT